MEHYHFRIFSLLSRNWLEARRYISTDVETGLLKTVSSALGGLNVDVYGIGHVIYIVYFTYFQYVRSVRVGDWLLSYTVLFYAEIIVSENPVLRILGRDAGHART